METDYELVALWNTFLRWTRIATARDPYEEEENRICPMCTHLDSNCNRCALRDVRRGVCCSAYCNWNHVTNANSISADAERKAATLVALYVFNVWLERGGD